MVQLKDNIPGRKRQEKAPQRAGLKKVWKYKKRKATMDLSTVILILAVIALTVSCIGIVLDDFRVKIAGQIMGAVLLVFTILIYF